jgi:hypothetical protein
MSGSYRAGNWELGWVDRKAAFWVEKLGDEKVAMLAEWRVDTMVIYWAVKSGTALVE